MKVIKHLIFFIILGTCHNSFSQKQNNQWRFGVGGAIDFNTVPPSFVNGCVIAATEGSASVADKVTGALLFYTDGVTVWNANNQVMPNGTGLLGGTPTLLSSTTAAVIVPIPGSSSLYYIVTIDEQASSNGVMYSVVDMTMNGGLGDIVAGQKNIFLVNTNSEKLEVVPAADGVSYWLLTRDNSGDSFYSFRINSAGIQNAPVISTVGSTQGNGAGHMKINRQFNKIAIGVFFGSKMELFDFDNTTGVVSNPISWNFNLLSPLIYGIEFSPDGKVLYITDLYTILQYDLTQTTPLAIQNSAYQVATGNNTSLQLGIDDKIYVNSGNINAINCPNKLGAACGYQTNVIANQTSGGGYGLPKWVYYAADTPIATSNSIIKTGDCQGLPISFSIQNVNNIVSVSWDFGDPASGIANNTSSSLTPQHTYNTAGTYTVNVVINYPCFTNTIPLTFIINPAVVPTFNPLPPFCAGTTAPILPTTSLNGITGTWLPATLSNTSSGNYAFTPNTGQCAALTPIQITVTANPAVVPTFDPIPPFCAGTAAPILPTTSINGITGTWLPATVSNTISGNYAFTPNTGQCAALTPIQIMVMVNPAVVPTFDPIPPFCAGTIVPILPTTSLNGITGTWLPATVSNTFSGNYAFTPNSGQCASTQTILTAINSNVVPTFNTVAPINVGQSLSPLPTTSINGITGTWSPALNNTTTTTYTFTPNAGQCAIITTLTITVNSRAICELYTPNAFTPNGDGINDKFYPLTICTFENYECLVYNRWGQLIFKTSNQTNKWDGKYNGSECSAGVYVYAIVYKLPSQPTKNINGIIKLIR
jgi:gliding motility-associated-like protein